MTAEALKGNGTSGLQGGVSLRASSNLRPMRTLNDLKGLGKHPRILTDEEAPRRSPSFAPRPVTVSRTPARPPRWSAATTTSAWGALTDPRPSRISLEK